MLLAQRADRAADEPLVDGEQVVDARFGGRLGLLHSGLDQGGSLAVDGVQIGSLSVVTVPAGFASEFAARMAETGGIRSRLFTWGFDVGARMAAARAAAEAEQRFSKDEILTRYVNTAFYGNGAYGIGAASALLAIGLWRALKRLAGEE